MVEEEEKEEEKEEAFNYDDILKYTGQMGKYQLRTCLPLLLPAAIGGIAVMCYSFTGFVPQYHCFLEDCVNTTSSIASPWLNENSSLVEDVCYRYNRNITDPDKHCKPHFIDPRAHDGDLLEKCNSWTYDTSIFKSTIVTDFDLTCDDEWKIPAASSAYMVGLLVGSFLLGTIADLIGRKITFTLVSLSLAIVMTATAFSPNYLTFAILRFFAGIFGMGIFLITFVWGMEATGKKYRVIVGVMYQSIFSIGDCLLGLVAYYIRDWRTLQLVISIPIFIPVLYYWFIPESTRWLITKKRYGEARKLIDREMKMNGKSVPDHLLTAPNDSEDNQNQVGIPSISQTVDNENLIKENVQTEGLTGVLRSPVLVMRLTILCVAWIAVSMSFYGISFAAANLSGDFFINYELLMVIEIPAQICVILAMNKAGRRITLSGGLILCGISCLATGLVPKDPAIYQIISSLVGKFFSAAVFATVYSYTTELFPTHSRTFTAGICSTLGRIGSISAPIIADMGRTHGAGFPFIVFSVISIASGLICGILPETNNIQLPFNIKEAEDLSKNSLSCFGCGKSKKRTGEL